LPSLFLLFLSLFSPHVCCLFPCRTDFSFPFSFFLFLFCLAQRPQKIPPGWREKEYLITSLPGYGMTDYHLYRFIHIVYTHKLNVLVLIRREKERKSPNRDSLSLRFAFDSIDLIDHWLLSRASDCLIIEDSGSYRMLYRFGWSVAPAFTPDTEKYNLVQYGNMQPYIRQSVSQPRWLFQKGKREEWTDRQIASFRFNN
jgi:hypothetical protein